MVPEIGTTYSVLVISYTRIAFVFGYSSNKVSPSGTVFRSLQSAVRKENDRIHTISHTLVFPKGSMYTHSLKETCTVQL